MSFRYFGHRHVLYLVIGLACLLGAACSTYLDLPPGSAVAVSVHDSAILEQHEVVVPPHLVSDDPAPADYIIGPWDVLFVNVSGQPEFGSPIITGNNSVRGSRVDGGGAIHLPLVGTVKAAGLTVNQLQQDLRKRYSRFLNEPYVVVEIVDYRSKPLYLLGQFRTPGTHYMDRPLNLVQGLALGGGLVETANLRNARMVRDGHTVAIDFFRLLQGETPQQNVWLRPGDTIFVPDDRNQNVFVFGAVTKPGMVPMPNGRLSLPQALAVAGVGEIRGQTSYVRVIRSHSPVKGELMVVDLERTLRAETLPFPLTEGDIVYVPRSAVGNWNEAIKEMLPSLQALSAVLSPFVQIKYLTDDDN
ncbi:MAG: polysaccharide export protein [Deltaproteobacteria bacterium]|nr:polysaccharide export protein [Deltaproteobacteria bacterium]